MKVPFFDLKQQTNNLKKALLTTFEDVLDNSEFIYGKYVTTFEKEFSAYIGVNNTIGVSNGADALYVALKALEIGPGDDVITTAHSWISTADAITRTGAQPIFVDTNEFHVIDPNLITHKITQNTKAILPVHLFGQMADISTIQSICDAHGLFMVEDCAQAHGATFNNIKAGLTGEINAFSFYPTKNFGAFGDAGAITTNSDELSIECRIIANNGLDEKQQPYYLGINSRMDALQAAFLSVKLNHLELWNRRRQAIAAIYTQELSNLVNITLPKTQNECNHIFHVFAIEVDNREKLIAHLTQNEIGTTIHYTYLLPFTENYTYQHNQLKDFPNSVNKSSRLLSLPMYPELTDEQVYFVCESIRSFYGN